MLNCVKGTVKEKFKGGLKSENLGSWTIPVRHLSDVSVSRNLYKIKNVYENSYTCNFV